MALGQHCPDSCITQVVTNYGTITMPPKKEPHTFVALRAFLGHGELTTVPVGIVTVAPSYQEKTLYANMNVMKGHVQWLYKEGVNWIAPTSQDLRLDLSAEFMEKVCKLVYQDNQVRPKPDQIYRVSSNLTLS